MRGILLGGGRSTRMGQKKQWLPFAGRPLLWHAWEMLDRVCDDVVIVANDEEDISRIRHENPRARVVRDVYAGQGPLAGLHAGLVGLPDNEIACLIGCDLPFLRVDVLADLLHLAEQKPHSRAIVPQDGDHLYPVCALYRGQVREIAASCLERQENALRRFLVRLEDVQYVATERWQHLAPDPFFNMNTPENYELACTLWKREGHDDE